jgi:hypothetical protein
MPYTGPWRFSGGPWTVRREEARRCDFVPCTGQHQGRTPLMSLHQVTRQHHAQLMPHVDALLSIAEMIGQQPLAELQRRLDEEYEFITGQLVPHMETVEKAVYPELRRLLQNPRAMSPMEREHGEVRRLIGELGALRRQAQGGGLGHGQTLQLRRVLIRLFAILKVHLVEEEEYTPLLEHNLTPQQAEALAASMAHAVREQL